MTMRPNRVRRPKQGHLFHLTRLLAFCGLAALALQPLSAQTPLTVDEAVQAALQSSSTLRRSAVDVDGQRRAVESLWSLFLPGISAGASTGYSRWLFSEPTAQQRNQDPWSTSTSLSASLNLNSNLPVTIATTRLAWRLGQESLLAERRALEAEVRKAFWSALNAQLQLALFESNFTRAEAQLVSTRSRYAAGLVSERALLQAQFAVENARFSLERSRLDAENQGRSLAERIGLPVGSVVEPQGDLELPPISLHPQTLIERHLERVPAVVAARSAVERQQLVVNNANLASRGPTVSLSARWSGTHSDPLRDSVSTSVGVSIPIDSWIGGSRGAQSIESAQRELQKTQIALDQARRTAQLQVYQRVATIQQALESLRIAGLQVQIAERSLELAEAGFAQGFVERLELDQRRAELLDARLKIPGGQYQYRVALIDLALLLGLDDPLQLGS